MSKKPCIQCGNECEILPVQMGDVFTLAYLRVCSPECMFLVAYEYLREIGYHKSFGGYLYDKQNEEDANERKIYVDGITEEALRMMREGFRINGEMLSAPASPGMTTIYQDVKPIPQCSPTPMRFTRPIKEDRIKWQREYVDRLTDDLREALEDLEKAENDRG